MDETEHMKIVPVVETSEGTTKRKKTHLKTKRAIQAAREYAENIVATLREPLVFLDRNLKVVSANRSFYQTFKVTPKETEGRYIYDLGNRQWNIIKLHDLLEEIIPKDTFFNDFEVEHDFPIIGHKTMLLNARRLYMDGTVILAIEDISERKKVEEERSKLLYDLGERVKELHCLYKIAELVEKFNISPDEILQRIANLLPSAYQYSDIICTRIIFENREFKTKNFKETQWKQQADIKINGKKVGFVEVFYIEEKPKIDEDFKEKRKLINTVAERLGRIIEHMRTEDALRGNESKSRTLLENLPQKIFFKDKNSVYISCNENYARDLKIKADEITGRTDYDFYPKELAEKYRADDKRIMESEEIEDIEEEYIQNGQKVFVHTVKTPIKDEKGNVVGILGIFWDITERKRMEQELLSSEKLAAIGKLASVVGHEIRNPLGVIKNSSYFLNMKLKDHADEKVIRHLKIIEQEVNSANIIVSDLLDFARKKIPILERTNLNGIMSSALANVSIPENIKLTTKLGKMPSTLLDREQIQRVFQNIIQNAVEAMPEGGKLTIQTLKTDDSAKISFEDSGFGITEENLLKLFTPLFSTKARGLGLGLIVCKQLVESHGGNITANSKVGKGTTFTVRLPIRHEKKKASEGSTLTVDLPVEQGV